MEIKINKYNENIQFVASTPNHRNDIKPLFFYHIPKTGGISFSSPLMFSAIRSFARIKTEVNPVFVQPITARVEENSQINNPKNIPYNFVCGHVNWGWHERCESDFFFSTIIRSPLSRVLSSYNYKCMREQRLPKREEFIDFFRNKDNQNVSCKLLNPDKSGACASGKSVFEHLQENFHSYITPTQINDLLAYYLSLYGFPNVIMEQVNATLAQYKLDGSEFLDELAELNREDLVLFKLVQNAPRLPILDTLDDSIADRIVVFNETEKELRSTMTSTEISTSQFFDEMDASAEQLTSIDKIITRFVRPQ